MSKVNLKTTLNPVDVDGRKVEAGITYVNPLGWTMRILQVGTTLHVERCGMAFAIYPESVKGGNWRRRDSFA